MSEYISRLAAGLEPYVPGKQPADVAGLIKINTNENPYPPAPEVLDAVREAANGDLRLYPDPSSTKLRQAIVQNEGHGLTEEHVFVGNGSDEVLAFCFPAFFTGGGPVSYADITYSFYKVFAALFAVQSDIIPLMDDYSVDVDAFCAADSNGVLLPNPNAPTGLALQPADIERILTSRNRLVIIDEAYVGFGAESCAALIRHYDNLLIVRTLSKTHSLAGIRLGYALGHLKLIEALTRVKDSFNSYPVDRVANAAGIAAVNAADYYRNINNKICETRSYFVEKLREMGFAVLDSAANFVFASPPDGNAERTFAYLNDNNVIARYFRQPRCDNWLRISIGSHDDMKKVASLLLQIYK